MSGLGTQLEAPQGYGTLSAQERYYFVKSVDEGVCLAWFARHKGGQRVFIINFKRREFEAAVLHGLIRRAPIQFQLPPGLEEMDGVNFDELEHTRVAAQSTNREYVEQRYAHIAPALERADDILSKPSPLKELADWARRCTPPQHPHRFQVWFFAYILHGGNIWALMRTNHNIGRWDRSVGKHRERKYGRPSKSAGAQHGFPTHLMQALIEKSYLDLCGVARNLKSIYQTALSKHFGCTVISTQASSLKVMHPENKPYPTYGQYRHAVVSKFGIEEVHRVRFGEARLRTKSKVDIGSFTERHANLLESLVVDAYYVKERPRNMLTGEPTEPLCVVRMVCATSSTRVGIGFAFGRERAQAYREALFSMAIPKSMLGRLYGVPITEDEWPCSGMAPAYVSDRGPGATVRQRVDLEDKFPVREMPPSYSGQSKATVEATHPRDDKIEGSPSFEVSHLNVIEMMRREILRAKKENHGSNVLRRVPPRIVAELAHDGLTANPINVWNYLDSRYRTCAVEMSIEQAVRAFLNPVSFTASKGQLWLHGLRYHCENLRSPSVLAQIAVGQNVEIRGYMLTSNVRFAWVEILGRLFEVEAQLELRDDPEQLHMPQLDLETHGKTCRAMASAQREHSDAAGAKEKIEFEACTGKPWMGGERRAGRAKKPTGVAKAEVEFHADRRGKRKAA